MLTSMRLWRRKNEVWYVELERGKHVSLRTKDEREAKRIYKELQKEWLHGRLIQLDSGKRVTLSEFTKDYLSYRENYSEKTYRQDRLALRLLADVIGGSLALRAITTRKIEEFKKACLARGCKPQSVNSYLRHIKAALGVAEEWYPPYQRAKIKFCKLGKPIPRILSPKQIDSLLDTAREKFPFFYPLMVFYLWTGVRRTEALRLRWQDVHLDLEEPFCIIHGKGDKERIIPLLPPVCGILVPLRKDIGPVFPEVHPDTITGWFIRLREECGIKARLHDLRHCAATYMINNDIPIQVVQKLLGHKEISTTQTIYADVLHKTLHREMQKLRFDW